MISLVVAGLLLVIVGSGGSVAMAGEGCGCGNCGGGGGYGVFNSNFQPNIIFYAPDPWWWPNYFGPPYSDYQVVQYVTPPAVSAEVVKERIAAINAANPALLPLGKEPLPFPKPDGRLPSPDEVPPKKK
jgi:hypothetical protein